MQAGGFCQHTGKTEETVISGWVQYLNRKKPSLVFISELDCPAWEGEWVTKADFDDH